MDKRDEVLDNLVQELRRGTLVLSVLSLLDRKQYGYSLVQSLEKQGISIEPGTLYPLLRRLEKHNLLVSKWETGGTKPRKYYSLSDQGKETYSRLCEEWRSMEQSIDKIINKG